MAVLIHGGESTGEKICPGVSGEQVKKNAQQSTMSQRQTNGIKSSALSIGNFKGNQRFQP